ncbi:MAG: geranylgeranyl reductase family protein [Planctomycetes bacterium]|nr:geranylgeranyl reductase family protein [Planctomycetota bacterium]
MPPKSFDCIVVGGGPAGSTAAYMLAGLGVNVAILECRDPSSPKVCGGGLQVKAASLLPFDVKEVVEREIYGMVFQRGLADRFTRRSKAPISYMLNRARFDNLLLGHAVESGVTLFADERALSIEPAAGRTQKTRISTRGGDFEARVVVGADGANSLVGRSIHPDGIAQVQLGIICELKKRGDNAHIPEDLFMVDWGTVPGGYAWTFPKEKTLTVGAMVPRELARTLNAYLKAYVEREGLSITDERLLAYPIPTRGEGEAIASAWGLLVGDAAGLTDPFTGEGLYYAIRSGQIAAAHVERFLAGSHNDGGLFDYEAEIDSGLMQEIIVAGKMRSFFNTFSRYIHNLYRRNDRLWYAFCEVLRGDRTLEGLRRVRTRPPKPILRYLERFTSWYEAREISRFDESKAFAHVATEVYAARADTGA